MSGNTANASLWADADVYVAPVGSTVPANATTAFNGSWSLVGLLDGEAGFTQSREEEKADHYAWGGILVRTSRRNFKLTRRFTALEDNATTRDLAWPDSPAGTMVVPRPERLLVAFETREGDKIRRLITSNYAEVEVDGDVTEGESDLSRLPFMVTVFPKSDGELFVEQVSPGLVSIALSPLTLALSAAGIKTTVATATYDDSSTADISAVAKWTTSDAAKATVAYGYVTGVANGTSNISCQYLGVTATAPCVATVS